MPLRKRLGLKVMGADADAHSKMLLELSPRQEDKALKLVSDSTDTKTHAQWVETAIEKAKENLCWGYLILANEDKSCETSEVLF